MGKSQRPNKGKQTSVWNLLHPGEPADKELLLQLQVLVLMGTSATSTSAGQVLSEL